MSRFGRYTDSIFASFKIYAFAKGYFPNKINEQASSTPDPVASAGSTSNRSELAFVIPADHVQIRLLAYMFETTQADVPGFVRLIGSVKLNTNRVFDSAVVN